MNIDRTTVYRMLKDGRLNGIKVGNQWRFPREEIDAILSGGYVSAKKVTGAAKAAGKTEPLPLSCMQTIQDVFAEVLDVGAIITNPNGEPLTKMSNPCQFCQLILSADSGRQACVESWKKLAQQPTQQTDFDACHAGLLYARSRIIIHHHFKAMFIVGQFYATPPHPTEETRRIKKLSQQHKIDEARLIAAAKLLPVLNQRIQSNIMRWLSKETRTLEIIGTERLDLINLSETGRL